MLRRKQFVKSVGIIMFLWIECNGKSSARYEYFNTLTNEMFHKQKEQTIINND
jgi:hypothetical protein